MANVYLNAAYEQQLPSSPKAVLVALANRANKEGSCFPSVRTLIADTGLSRSTVFKSLSALVEDKLLERAASYRKDGSQKSSTYKLLLSVASDKAKETIEALKTKAVEFAKPFIEKPSVKTTSALQLTYDSHSWSSTVEDIKSRVLELYPNTANYPELLLDSIEDQLEYWMLKANSSHGRLKLSVPQLRAYYLKYEANYLTYLNTRSQLSGFYF